MRSSESAKCVMTKDKLDKQLAFKTFPSRRHKSMRFNEYKVMGNKSDRLA